MKKTFAALALALTLISAHVIYPAAMIVDSINDGVATLKTSTGYTYTIPAEDYMIGDIVACIMYDGGRPDHIADDTVLIAHYSGFYFDFFDFQ